MTVLNLGSINVDQFYRVPHLPAPGETLAACDHKTGLGGKGANQSVAVARAGRPVVHIGTVGPDGAWARDRLAEYGVDVSQIASVETPTGHAIINVDDRGENTIVIFPGANKKQSLTRVKTALSSAKSGDSLMMQNETTLQPETARAAKAQGLFVIYSAAPFDAEAVKAVLPFVDLLVMNEVEAGQLTTAMGIGLSEIPVPHLLVTKGAEGSLWRDQSRKEEFFVPAFPAEPVDTTGAGDCFIGYTAAGLDEGLPAEEAMRLGAAAAAIKVTRHGTADAIPTRVEVDAFLAGRG